MNQSMKSLLAGLLLMGLLSGCSTLQAWEQFRGQDQESQESDDSSAGTSAAQTDTPPAQSEPERPVKKPSDGKIPSDRVPPESPAYPESPTSPESPAAEPPAAPAGDPSLEALQDEICRGGGVAGLAFIGYVDSQSAEADLRDYIAYSDIGQELPFLRDASIVMNGGQELYAVVPPNQLGTVTVYASDITESGEYVDDTSTPFYTGMPGEAVIVQCNLSEIYSNVLISVTDGGGAIEFRPSLSMMDGRIVEMAGVYDFSVYA